MTVRQTIIGRENMKTHLNEYALDNQSVEKEKKITEQKLKLAVSAQYIAASGPRSPAKAGFVHQLGAGAVGLHFALETVQGVYD